MSQQIIDHIVNPDGTIIEIHDHGRGQPNGVALLNNQKKLESWLESLYIDSCKSPVEGKTLMAYCYNRLYS